MTRSRAILLFAWGLLAIGGLFQLVRPDNSSSESAGDSQSTDEDTELAYRDTDDQETADRRSTGRIVRDGDSTPGAEAATDLPGRSGSSATDPADGQDVEIELDAEAFVATVKSSSVPGHGVASLLQPGEGALQHWFPSPTQFGGDRVFLVLDQTTSQDYVKVSLPVMPNGQEGWIPRSEVEITKVEHRALIDLSAHSVTVWDGQGLVTSTEAVIGRPSTPTPLGTFYVRDIVAQDDPEGSFGPYVLALSGFSEVLETFEGGLPALAIHGTDRPEQVGTGRSAGCIRIPNDLIAVLAESVPLGTPVTIVA